MTTKKILVVEHAVDIISCFTSENNNLSLAELDKLLDIPKSTIHRILISLESKKVLVFNDKTKQYALGPVVLNWSSTMLHKLKIHNIARPYLVSFRDRSGETATLSLRVNLKRVYIEQVVSKNEVRVSVEIGKFFPLHAGANGKVIMAFLPHEQIEQIINSDISRYTSSTITEKQYFLAELNKIQEVGYAVSVGERVLGSSAVAAPIFSKDGDIIGSIGIKGPSGRFTEKELHKWGPQLCQAAKKISKQVITLC